MPTLLLRERSNEKEILDLGRELYEIEEFTRCQKILYKINRLLGFFSHTKYFLKQFSPEISVLDVGCGGGLFILNMSKYFPKMHFTGCDISEDAILMAEEESTRFKTNKVLFNLQQQLRLELAENSVDIIVATLVCHHIEDKDLVNFLQDVIRISRRAVLINDLHRHIIPYFFYKIFSPMFRNRLINHDGLISIKRGFKRNELCHLLQKANIAHFTLKWRFPFCWSLVLWKK